MLFVGLFIFLLAFCGALLFVMYRVLKSQTNQAAEQLSVMSGEQDKKKEALQKQLKDVELQTARILNEARQEAERIKKEAHEKADGAKVTAEEAARKEAERIIEEAFKAREALKKDLVSQMEVLVAEKACELALHALPLEARQRIHQYMLEELMHDGLRALEKVDSKEKIEEIKVFSAFSLSEEEKEKILQTVSKKINGMPELKENVDEKLVAGFRIVLGHLILEGSLAARLKEAARHEH